MALPRFSDHTFDRLLALATFLLGIGFTAHQLGWGDYPVDAGPSLVAIAHGDVHGFFANQPAMGPLSLYLRVPSVVIASALHAGSEGVFQWGVLPCMLALCAAATWCGVVASARGIGRTGQAVIVIGCVINPCVAEAITAGHPEEILTAALCLAAVMAATEQRALPAAVLAGLAMASKQWALLILLPVVLLLEGGRVRAVIASAIVAAVVTLPMVVVDFPAFHHALAYIAKAQDVVSEFNWLYPFSRSGVAHYINIVGPPHLLYGRYPSPLVQAASHPLIVLLGVTVPLAVWMRARRCSDVQTILYAAAIVFLLRGTLDPESAPYYYLPLLLLLFALDATSARRLPVAGLIGIALSFTVLDRFPLYLGTSLANGLYFAASAAGLVALVLRCRASLASPGASANVAEPRGAGRGRPAPFSGAAA